MNIRFKDEYRKAIAAVDPNIKKNGAFKLDFENFVEDLLYRGEQVELEISEDGKRIRAIEKIPASPLSKLEISTVVVVDVSLDDDNNIEVLRSDGNLKSAPDYYKTPTASNKPSEDVSSVLSVSYDRSIYDAEGIQMHHTNYFKGGIPCANVNYSDTESLIQLLLSAGNIMPLFYGNSVEIPNNSSNSILDILTRDKENPSIVVRTRFERGKSADNQDFSVSNYSKGYVNSYWPELLRFSGEDAFADNIDGEWVIRKDGFRTGGSSSVDEVIDRCAYLFSELLENSNTKKSCPTEYNALRTRIDNVIAKIEERPKTR